MELRDPAQQQAKACDYHSIQTMQDDRTQHGMDTAVVITTRNSERSRSDSRVQQQSTRTTPKMESNKHGNTSAYQCKRGEPAAPLQKMDYMTF
jgi:hypothetical protein